MIKKSRIFIAGSSGLVGSALFKKLKEHGYTNIITSKRKELDFSDKKKTFRFLKKIKPDYVFVAAAKVAGIEANNRSPAEFLYQNLIIEMNLIHGCYQAGVKNLLFLASSCAYPMGINKPIKEKELLNGILEKTNEGYSIAKLAGIKLCELYSKQYKLNYFSVMPCNTYGPNDNFNLSTSHFIPALISKIHSAKINRKKKIILWGSGKPLREVLYVEDLADALIFLCKKKHKKSLINIGSNIEYSINSFAKKIMKILNYKCKIEYDKKKPDGVKRKKLDTSLISQLGWRPKIKFNQSIIKTYKFYKDSK